MTKVTPLSLDEERGQRRIHLREISGDSESPLETVGQYLRTARLRRGDDLATVSRSLKIRKDHLEAVENDDLQGLPGKTYAIGFVRSYAGYLGLDTSQMVERFKQEIAGRHDETTPLSPVMNHDDSRRLPQGWRIMAGLVGLALKYGAWHLLAAGPTPQPVPPPPVIAPPHPQTAAAKPVQTAVPPPAANVIPAAPASATASPPPAATPSATAPQPVATPTQTATPSPAVPAVPAAQPAAASPGQVYGALNQNPRVILRARADTRVTVRGEDGTLYLNKDLKSGDSYRVPNIVGLALATSNGAAVEIDLDGIALGRAGQPQQVLGRVSLDPQSLADRFNQ